MITEIGRVCVKIAGRDAGGKCVVLDVLDKNHVLIDGEVRRKKVNTLHLEPLDAVVKIKKGAAHEEVMAALKDLSKEEKAESKPAKAKRVAAKPAKKTKKK